MSNTVPDWLKTEREDARRLCAILYSRGVSWECGDGWNSVLANLSYKLEELNYRFYGKYRVKVTADQVKEKFGTLRFYYTVSVDQPAWRAFPTKALHWTASFIERRLDFKLKNVVDLPAYTKYTFTRLPDDADDSCGRSYSDSAGRRYTADATFMSGRSHFEPTRHRLAYKLVDALYAAATWLANFLYADPSPAQRVIEKYIDGEAEAMICDAENKCEKVCERCGRALSDDSTCVTQGWITIVCEQCVRPGARYKKLGKIYMNGKEVAAGPGGGDDENKN